MTPELPTAPFDFPVGTFRSPTSILLWGSQRYPLSRMMVALARRVDPGFLWLEVRDPEIPAEPGEPSTTGELGSSRHFVVVAADALGLPPPLGESSDMGGPSGNPSSEGAAGGSGHLPTAISELIDRVRPGRGPRILAVANVDRVWSTHSDAPTILRHLLTAARTRGITLVASATSVPRPDRAGFDHVLHVSVPPHHPWTESVLEVERGPLSDLLLGRVPVRHFAAFAREFSGG